MTKILGLRAQRLRVETLFRSKKEEPLKGRRCLCCNHREHAAIDLALARGVSAYAIAARYGMEKNSVYRHSRNHLPPQVRARLIAGPDIEIDLDRLRETESQSLLANLVAIRHRLFASLDVAEEAGDGNMISRLAGQLHKNLEIVGKLLGDLAMGSTTINNNVLILPSYLELRIGLVEALAPFPEAKLAVAKVLHRLEDKSAAAVAAELKALAQ